MTKKNVTPIPEKWVALLSQMIESGDFIWAEDTLMGIRETIEERKSVTERQMKAIMNIRRSIQ